MENVNARRGFLKGFGLLGAAAGGFVAAQNSFANTPPPSPIGAPTVHERDNGPVEDITHLAPLGKINLQLTADNTPPSPPPSYAAGAYIFDGRLSGGLKETDNRVTLSVGKDDRLWIKVGDTWRRVAIEG